MICYSTILADPDGHAVYGEGLQPLDYWDRGSNPADVMNVRPLCFVVCSVGSGKCSGVVTRSEKC
jgi:hypothetical protein